MFLCLLIILIGRCYRPFRFRIPMCDKNGFVGRKCAQRHQFAFWVSFSQPLSRKIGRICEEQEPPWQDVSEHHHICCHISLDELRTLQSEVIVRQADSPRRLDNDSLYTTSFWFYFCDHVFSLYHYICYYAVLTW